MHAAVVPGRSRPTSEGDIAEPYVGQAKSLAPRRRLRLLPSHRKSRWVDSDSAPRDRAKCRLGRTELSCREAGPSSGGFAGELDQLGREFPWLGSENRVSGYNHVVEPLGQLGLNASERLAHETLGPVAPRRLAELLRGRDAQARRCARPGPCEKDTVAPNAFVSRGIRLKEISTSANPAARRIALRLQRPRTTAD